MNDFEGNEVNYFRVKILLSKNYVSLRKKGLMIYEWGVNVDKCGFKV